MFVCYTAYNYRISQKMYLCYSIFMIDLHSHSTASDGQYSPSELIQKALSEGVRVLALTDHDTVAGHEEASEAAKKAGIVFIPGTELQIEWPTGEFHLLGLGIMPGSKKLSSIISYLQDERKRRNLLIVQKMRDGGVDITMDEMEELFAGQTVGRPHFADFLVLKKIVKTRQEAFDKYFARGRPWYIPRKGAGLQEAVEAILDASGVPVIAHPLSLYISWGKLENTLRGIYDSGVQGLEAWHPGVRVVDAERLEAIARKIGFFVTAGSDFHGEKVRAERRLGHTSGGKAIEDRFWTEELRPHLKNFTETF